MYEKLYDKVPTYWINYSVKNSPENTSVFFLVYFGN